MEPENFDEEWWTAILAYEGENEDELIAEYPSNEPSRPAQTVEFDWEVIERIYRQDEVVVVTVHAFNRGGLLVRGSCFQGFVPNSHLVRSSTGNGRQKSSHQYVGRVSGLRSLNSIESKSGWFSRSGQLVQAKASAVNSIIPSGRG